RSEVGICRNGVKRLCWQGFRRNFHAFEWPTFSNDALLGIDAVANYLRSHRPQARNVDCKPVGHFDQLATGVPHHAVSC
ncbi:MAG: hypothetical protein ACR2NU_03830, partial [Aeoliella sp.]